MARQKSGLRGALGRLSAFYWVPRWAKMAVQGLALSGFGLMAALADPSPLAVDAPLPTWDVRNPTYSGPPRAAEIDVTEGTWLSIDVSPDGQTLIFDLLGDLYLLDIVGGVARSLTSGLAWDIQPRFSPDGKQVVFISDRAGGDNVWVMTLASGALKQITKESFRLMNSPVWHPNGQFIAAKKHFTTSRSLGTGEIWLYDATLPEPSEGVELVARPNKNYQKELGEPAFSADGETLFYTQSATSGNTFIYHDDSHGGLFQIKQLDLKTGETDVVAGGYGGAVRPVPSPDGHHLAYVKRVRSESRLFVMDLDSQAERMLVDDLDPDMQETWGVYGLYPNMAWLPDSQGLIYWAGGGFFKVDLTTGEQTAIAFRVQDQRSVYEPPDVEVSVSDETFKTRMVRFARSSPKNDEVVFESLGRLFIKKGTSTPKPLLKNMAGHHVFAPVFDQTGARIYFLSWSDEALGGIWSAASRGGKAEALPLPPGHYTDLAISQDDRYLAYRKHAGSSLTHPDWGQAPGIYLFDRRESKEIKISDRGFDPHFGPEERLYYTDRKSSAAGRGSDSDAKTVLLSRNFEGFDERQLAQGDFVRRYQLSPDGQHLAFIENFQLYVTKVPALGIALDLSADYKGLSMGQASELGANYLAWSKDGGRISWSIGAQYKTRSVRQGLAWATAAEAVDLSQTVETDQPTGVVALTGARIITMDEAMGVIAVGTILIDGARIVQVGAIDEVVIPEGAARVDLSGKTLMPGMIDAHAHGPYGRADIIPQNNWSLLAHLALGVTTVHNPSSQASQVFAAAEYQKAGRILGPRIFSTGEVVYGAKSLGFAKVDALSDALTHVNRLKAQGAISIKNYNQPRREQRQQVIEAARQAGMLVVAEGGSLFHQDMNLIVDGSTGIEHNIPTLKIYDDVVQLWRQSNSGYTPTLVVTYGGLTSEDYYYQTTEVWKHPLLSHFVPPDQLQARSVRRVMAPESDFKDDDAAAVALQLANEGVIVNTGAHGQREGLATHWELWSFVRGGFTPLAALKLATINPAHYLGMQASLGSLTAGKLADILVLSANPLEDIHNTQSLERVMLNGRLYDAQTLQEQITGDRPAPKLWWHDRAHLQIR